MDKQAKVDEDKENRKPQKEGVVPKIQENGRPPFKKDEEPRKKRVETPKSTPGVAELIVWATSALESVDIINKGKNKGIDLDYIYMYDVGLLHLDKNTLHIPNTKHISKFFRN